MYKEKTVAVVVPAYDEAGFVGEVIDTMPSFVDRIYPVDDCSTDGTWAEILAHARRTNSQTDRSLPASEDLTNSADDDQSSPLPDGRGRALRRRSSSDDRRPSSGDDLGSHSEEDPRSSSDESSRSSSDDDPRPPSEDAQCVVPLRHDENRGVGAAIKTGYRRAYRDGADVVAVMAGDGQMDPDLLDEILDPVVEDRAEYAKGNRLVSGTDREGMSGFRLFGNVLLTMLTKVASGYWKMMDPQNGYTAISRTALDRLDLDAVFDDYGFANAMLVHLNVADARVADVPMSARYGDEDSDIRYSTFVPQLSLLLARGFGWRLSEKYLRRKHPLPVLYGLGVLGTLGGAYAAVRDRLSGDGRTGDPDSLEGNENDYEENEYNGERNVDNHQSNDESSGGCGRLAGLFGLVTTGLAVAFDAAENERLHVPADDERDGRTSETGDASPANEEETPRDGRGSASEDDDAARDDPDSVRSREVDGK